MNWYNIIAGIVGVVGVAINVPQDVGSWLIGLAFLVLAIKGFAQD